MTTAAIRARLAARGISGIPNGAASGACPLRPLTDPRARDWDETPAEAARYDRAYYDDLYDRD